MNIFGYLKFDILQEMVKSVKVTLWRSNASLRKCQNNVDLLRSLMRGKINGKGNVEI